MAKPENKTKRYRELEAEFKELIAHRQLFHPALGQAAQVHRMIRVTLQNLLFLPDNQDDHLAKLEPPLGHALHCGDVHHLDVVAVVRPVIRLLGVAANHLVAGKRRDHLRRRGEVVRERVDERLFRR